MRQVYVTVPSRRAFQRLEATGLDVTHDAGPGYARVLVSGASELALLRRVGPPLRVEIADLAAHDRRTRAADAAYSRSVGVSVLPTGRTEYRDFEDYQAELQQMLE